jgi:hypothetical protein
MYFAVQEVEAPPVAEEPLSEPVPEKPVAMPKVCDLGLIVMLLVPARLRDVNQYPIHRRSR